MVRGQRPRNGHDRTDNRPRLVSREVVPRLRRHPHRQVHVLREEEHQLDDRLGGGHQEAAEQPQEGGVRLFVQHQSQVLLMVQVVALLLVHVTHDSVREGVAVPESIDSVRRGNQKRRRTGGSPQQRRQLQHQHDQPQTPPPERRPLHRRLVLVVEVPEKSHSDYVIIGKCGDGR